MSKIHILESDNNHSYKVAIHFATPSGTNSASMNWKECALANGSIGSTILEVGTNPGNITQTEYNSIIAGNTIEIIKMINPGLNPSNTDVEETCDILISTYQEDMARILKYYGHKIEGV